MYLERLPDEAVQHLIALHIKAPVRSNMWVTTNNICGSAVYRVNGGFIGDALDMNRTWCNT